MDPSLCSTASQSQHGGEIMDNHAPQEGERYDSPVD